MFVIKGVVMTFLTSVSSSMCNSDIHVHNSNVHVLSLMLQLKMMHISSVSLYQTYVRRVMALLSDDVFTCELGISSSIFFTLLLWQLMNSPHFTFSIHFHCMLLHAHGLRPNTATCCSNAHPDICSASAALKAYGKYYTAASDGIIAAALNVFILQDEAAHVHDYAHCSYNVGLNNVFIFVGCCVLCKCLHA